jgi:hypothetical protein
MEGLPFGGPSVLWDYRAMLLLFYDFIACSN